MLVQLQEDILSDVCLLFGRGAAPVVEADIEPLVYLRVNSMVLVTELLRGEVLFNGFGFGGGAVLVCPADEQGGVTSSFAVPI